MEINAGEVYRDSNKATMDYAKNAIQFAFLMNGAAATALFARAGTQFILPAILFALGAGIATICMGFSYLAQYLITETWRQNLPARIEIFGKICSFPLSKIQGFRLGAMFLWLASMTFFFIGIGGALARV